MKSEWKGGEEQSEGEGIGMAIGNGSSTQSPRAKRDFLCNDPHHPPPSFSYNGLTIRNAGQRDRPFVPLSNQSKDGPNEKCMWRKVKEMKIKKIKLQSETEDTIVQIQI